MDKQVEVDAGARATEFDHDGVHEVANDLAYKRLFMVNVGFFGRAGQKEWVLVDAGIPGTAPLIAEAAGHLFGAGTPPVAIVLTHGHFDHVGALHTLAEKWNVPIYAHEIELPYLSGEASYPPPDPTVGGGMLAATAGLYPRGPIDVSKWLRALPDDGAVPGMTGWKWIHTPGHTEGHVSLWRESDRTLIVGDAFITTKQESAYAVATQRPELHGPPMYFTPDWESAASSVRKLAAHQPELVVTGHGRALHGETMRTALDTLARDFEKVAVPTHGKYVDAPVADSSPANARAKTATSARSHQSDVDQSSSGGDR
jgi:glyoxylase-like metal-dependent hydrolase (beta-lactamase superfamily II)